LRTKVAFLSTPGSYPEQPAAVEVVQTHMSCVFLTDRHAYKLKKPVRCDFLDFSTLAARRADCEEELRLNRRLARDVYLDVVPLTLTRDGGLAVGGDGKIVDWLVKMRRLPARQMLDRAIREGNVDRDDVRRCALVLADFFRRSEPVAMAPREYRDRFRTDILANRRALAAPVYGLSPAPLESVTAGLLAVLEREAASFDRRVAERRIVEGHGDLRPEHVCLGAEPLFIDCLEFNPRWRMLDPADELSGLAMECEFAGAPWIGEVVLDTYREATGDDPPGLLLDFYRSFRAAVRAKLAAAHLEDHLDSAEQGKWLARAARYLELANRHAATASSPRI
jgi:aminoglycoside phosphotransferase family enzyme